MKNLAMPDNGGCIESFSSQYHHESRCLNLMNRDPCLVWFSHNLAPLPQHFIIKLQKLSQVKRVGIFIHGENNQNPKHIQIHVSSDGVSYTKVVDAEIEQRSGDYLYDICGLSSVVERVNIFDSNENTKPVEAQFVKFEFTENYGGSGVYVAKAYVFGL
ncbi:hypothetical protein C9374_009152 [Naegleria lovaniensis]|uniref:F5/8 type C domain-containing protein n=1 Tax=Naegleria lovaniensis TaxID=51637 RepID=A0AA88KGZ1_NAELO|nr:uncharacterized protein C9374_009152 [Naegleria lovaniensis]KAG2377636.1 hypothetical protein C9374_009152 [Naegleria lovaniensis]